MISSIEIYNKISMQILDGGKIPHSTSQPLLYKVADRYCLAVFVFFYTFKDIESGQIDRPTMWAVADLQTGEIIERYQCKDKDFSDASYDKKYNIKSDKQYDTSKEYYEKAFSILDEVRAEIIETGKLNREKYQQYLDKIIANIPEEYQRFYLDFDKHVI